jgi:class 3 adenylate cyclase/tetratricopeptide (TPR) repeat protein/ribosomal protein L40E
MQCTKCKYDNPADAFFCMKCGTRLEHRCALCQTINPPDAKFCRKCGSALRANPAMRDPVAPATPSFVESLAGLHADEDLDGERKMVTALFADIKGSMELMEDLDPENARAIVDPALKLMIEAVHRYGGFVVQSTGDGIFALFGAPVAHEDHPQRALYSALRMHEAMRHYGERLRAEKGLNLQLRIGVNIGEVVVRTIQTGTEHTEYSPIGHSISLAARLQTLATPGSTVISGNMRGLVEGYFQLEGLGPTRIKGVSEPVELFEVTGLGPLRTRLQRAAGRGLTKFVGREREMEALRHAAAVAREGRGQILAAIAEPGVGKSRLFYEFKASSASGWMVLEALSISHGKESAYLPVIDLLRNYFKISAADDERTRREKIAGKVTVLDRKLEDTLPYLFSLLGIVEGNDPLAQMDGQIKKRRTLEAIKRILLRESLNQPLMVVFEDLHWMDGESEALLNLLADSIGTSPVMLLVNYRPDYRHQWGSKTYYAQLRLDPLGKESADDMLSNLLGSDTSLVPLKRLIAEKTEGNPLFMEEIVLSLFDDGALARNGEVKLAKPLASLRIPPTVQGILASRIDWLPADEKELLQTVAVIGTEFNLGVARAVSGKSDDALNRMFNDLQLAEFVYEQPASGDVEYTFKHALTHDVAYNSLLADRRKHLHERTAQAIETLYSERVDDHLTELAHHYCRSGNVPKAVEYLARTGQRAIQQTANSEAIGYFTRALELLRQLPESSARDRQELELQMTLSWSLLRTGFLASPEREYAVARAQELCERLEDDTKLMEVLLALAQLHFNRRDFARARELTERVLVMDQQIKASGMLSGAHALLGLVLFGTGEFLAARDHFQSAVELFDAGLFRTVGLHLLFYRGASTMFTTTVAILGYPSSALSRARELIAAARRSADPLSISNALLATLMSQVVLRDTRMVVEGSGELLSIANEHELRFPLMLASFLQGWTLTAAGRAEEGIAEMRRGVSDPRFAATVMRALLSVTLAETCGKNGRAQEGLDLVAKDLATAEQTGLRATEAELHRLKGELLLIKNVRQMVEAERYLRTAIDIAHRQGARLFELRATVSLARLLRNTNRRAEANNILAEIYNWFTEGFDLPDLREAKALLDESAA